MIEYQDCPSCGTEKIRTTVRVCGVCETAERYEEQVDDLKAKLEVMTRFRDNASFREKMALRERDEARAERDTLFRALVRRGAGDHAKKLTRMARNRVVKMRTTGLVAPPLPIGGDSQ